MRLRLALLTLVVVCAVTLVSAQHNARRFFAQLEQEQNRQSQLDIEYGQLQLEQSTWALHSRVERIATERLHMRPLDPRRTQLVPVPAGDSIAER
jgi:cell division protein FtsL